MRPLPVPLTRAFVRALRRALCRPRLAPALLLCLCALAGTALAEPLPALLSAPGEQATPGDSAWPLGPGAQAGIPLVVEADSAQPDPGGQPSFRVEIRPGGGAVKTDTAALRTCLGLTSSVRRNLYRTRALEFNIKASRPVQAIVTLSSTNTENPKARDRHFGSFTVGAAWKTLRLPYGSLAPLPGWPEEARRLGFEPGDLVLRPDSVEDICIGAEAGRLDAQPLTLWIGGLRFAR